MIIRRNPGRRNMLRAALSMAALSLAAAALPAAGQGWPERPVRIVVPYAAGQGADILARLLADELAKRISQPIVVENRAGAGGNIGTAAVARAPADGHTFLLGTNATNAANEFLYDSPGFNAATDFAPVAMIGLLPMVISTSTADFPVNGIPQLIEQARAKPDTLNVGLPSTTAQVVFSEFVRAGKAPLFAVRYKSSGQSMTDAIGGRIPLVIDTVTATRPQVEGGKLRALGITSLKPTDMLPGVKPVSEQGVPGFDIVAWDALFAPRGTPADAVKSMSDHVQAILRQADVRKRMQDIGVEPLIMNADELGEFVKNERKKWGDIIKEAGISLG
ncbi:MAG: tripartite tricarboxylate transporter substrate binding protein [Alcaligenaceae bacterium]|nr:tripartite tricarboxylate transporter substrate binding protein [Alcaligenaceae bacterium]